MYPFAFNMSVCCGFVLIWIITLLQPHFSVSAACLEDERSFLLDFKAGLNLSSGRLSSWRGFNCCQWEGVACDYHTSHVIRLDLSNPGDYNRGDDEYWYSQQLSGELRPSLFNLRHLQLLDLSENDFQGISIPSQLSKLQRLTFLKLAHAGFWGEVPLELGNMSSLRHLDVSDNYREFKTSDNYWQLNELKSSRFDVWVRNLRSLEFLGMESVNLSMGSEQWGEALNSLPNLTQIHLSGCGLSGNIPDLLNLTHLSHLHLGSNSFPFALPSWFQNVSSLVSLDLSFCDLNGFIPSNFMPHSRINNLELTGNYFLRGDLSCILGHSSSLVALSLAACNLSGEFPPSIANFSKLERMDLGSNNLSGTIPSFLGSLTSLTFLDLSHNQLSGQIPEFPPSIANFSKLERMDLRSNNLSGTIPSFLGSLTSLTFLHLSHNQLSGQISRSLCQLPALSELSLGHNQLSGTIPDSISKLARLEALSLASNGLRGNISLQLFENLTRLQALDLSENQFHINISTSWVPQFASLDSLRLRSCNMEGELPPFLSQQYQLWELDLSDNKMVGNLPSWLWDLPLLDMVNLSNNQLEGSLPRQISHPFYVVDLHGNRLQGSLPALDFVSFMLDLSNNGFNGSIPEPIGRFRSLSLSGNNLTGEIPSSICNDSGVSGVLDLSKNKLTGMIPSNIGQCSNLQILKLTQNILQGKIPKGLGNLQTLRTLNLNGNRLQGIIPPSIANCTDLQIFDLGNNNFEGSIPVWIEKLTDLRILSLASNKFNGRIPPQLFRLQNLQILELPGNQLSGNIPSDVSKLCALVNSSQSFYLQYSTYYGAISTKYTNYGLYFADEVTVWIKGRATLYPKIIGQHKFMDLSGNNLSGHIPPKLGLLRGLISLNISKNNLSGIIPESLGALTYLESLDLSENKLSGDIPSQLLNLTFLAVLNLSTNMLSGLIPQGKQFSTFEASSFLGNPNLHGPPLENKTRSFGFGKKDNYTELNNTATESVDVDVMDQWWAVGVGLSYGLGFATVIAVLCFLLKWRSICFSVMDNFIHHLFE